MRKDSFVQNNCFLFKLFQAQFEDKESGKVVVTHLKEVLPFSTKNRDGHLVQVLTGQKPPSLVVSEYRIKSVIYRIIF